MKDNSSLKFKLTSISDANRAALSEDKQGFKELLSELTAAQHQLRTLDAEVVKLRDTAERLDKSAARDAHAAQQLAGVEIQLSRLRSLRESQAKRLAVLLSSTSPTIYRSRRQHLAPAVMGPLMEGLKNAVADALEPFIGDRLIAGQFTGQTLSAARLSDYWRRMAPTINSAEDAASELDAAIAEIDSILSGRPFIDLDMRNPAALNAQL